MSETQQLNARISELQMEIASFKELEIRFKAMLAEKERLERTIIELTQELDSWKMKYNQLRIDYDRFMIDYESLKEKYTQLEMFCEELKVEMDKKSLFISKMQQSMVSTCTELDRVSKGGRIILNE